MSAKKRRTSEDAGASGDAKRARGAANATNATTNAGTSSIAIEDSEVRLDSTRIDSTRGIDRIRRYRAREWMWRRASRAGIVVSVARSTTEARAVGGTIVDGGLARRPVAEVCEADATTPREEARRRDRARRNDARAVDVYPKDRPRWTRGGRARWGGETDDGDARNSTRRETPTVRDEAREREIRAVETMSAALKRRA